MYADELITLNMLYCILKISFNCYSGCWNPDPHARPSFVNILRELEVISRSSFMNTPQESFHSEQEKWKCEIEEMFHELRCKEKVSNKVCLFLIIF